MATEPVTPSWFKQRQCKAEPAGDNVYRLTGPNLPEAFIAIRSGDGGRWAAALTRAADGPDLEATPVEFEKPWQAWEAAFELYRERFVT